MEKNINKVNINKVIRLVNKRDLLSSGVFVNLKMVHEDRKSR